MLDADSLASLNTRSAVRGFLASQLSDLIGGKAQHELPEELAGLATGSDREIIETARRLDKSYETCSAADAKSPGTVMGRKIRDLFASALQRMKQLPPDPRETLHVPVPVPAGGANSGQKRRTRR